MAQIYQLALKKNEPITVRIVKRAGHAKTTGEAIAHFRKLEEMGRGRVEKTSQTYKFLAFSENEIKKVAVGGSKVSVETDISPNNLESSNSTPQKQKGGSKVISNSKPDAVTDIAKRWQGGSTSSSKIEESQVVDVSASASRSGESQAKVAVGGSKVSVETDISLNNLESSNSTPLEQKGGSKVTPSSTPNTTTDTDKRWQGGSTSFSNSEDTKYSPKSINDFKVGQKIQIDGIQLFSIIASIERDKGFITGTDGIAFDWQRCTIIKEA